MKEVLFLISLTLILEAETYEKLKNECYAGKSEDCVNLGIFYHLGKDVNQSYSKANKYYSMACELNHSYGCLNLGDLYYFGQGVEQNSTKAKMYYDKACKLQNEDGCNNLKSLVVEEELQQKQEELKRLQQEQKELIQEAEVLDNI